MKNFQTPFFALNMADFRRRWHLSLRAWLIDYVYIPLGGSRVKTWRKVFNVMMVFFISGIWHGADWSYVVWAVLAGLIVSPYVIWPHLLGKRFIEDNTSSFLLFTIPLVYFRAHDISEANGYYSRIFTAWLLEEARKMQRVAGISTGDPSANAKRVCRKVDSSWRTWRDAPSANSNIRSSETPRGGK